MLVIHRCSLDSAELPVAISNAPVSGRCVYLLRVFAGAFHCLCPLLGNSALLVGHNLGAALSRRLRSGQQGCCLIVGPLLERVLGGSLYAKRPLHGPPHLTEPVAEPDKRCHLGDPAPGIANGVGERFFKLLIFGQIGVQRVVLYCLVVVGIPNCINAPGKLLRVVHTEP